VFYDVVGRAAQSYRRPDTLQEFFQRCGRVGIYLLVVCPLLPNLAEADVYKWVGPDGRIHYGDQPPQDNSAKRVAGANSANFAPLTEVEIEESTVKYFQIYGTTARELQNSILTNGPFNQIVQRHVNAECGWRIKWAFEYIREPKQCRIGKFKITLSTEITMPRWMNPEAADESVQSLWNRVAKDIRTHEDGHKANGVQAANVLARRLRALAPSDDCVALNAEIEREGKRIYAEYSLLDRAYDRTEALKIRQGGRLAE
jgi:predicted secreted Zn-dependent protease